MVMLFTKVYMGTTIGKQRGFTLVMGLIIVLVLLVVGAASFSVIKRNKTNNDISTTPDTIMPEPEQSVSEQNNQNSPDSQTSTQQVANGGIITRRGTVNDFTLKNEGLTFTYNPKISTLTPKDTSVGNDLYVEYVNIKTGAVKLSITAGIDGIGGSAQCPNFDRDTCKVLTTKQSTFLKDPLTYRLVKTDTVQNCGSDGSPNCDVVPLTTGYIIDTSTSTDFYGPCCGTITTKARNTGKAAKVTGSLLVSIDPDKQIENADLFKNSDFLETIKIIESMRY